MTEAFCDCTGSPPWPAMIRLRGGGPNRYYLCRECSAIREDVYRDRAITGTRWHEGLDADLPRSVREEATEILEEHGGEQLELKL